MQFETKYNDRLLLIWRSLLSV